MLIEYAKKYNLFVFVFNSTEVRTETLTIFCVMISLLVDTLPDFGLLRVVRPYVNSVMWILEMKNISYKITLSAIICVKQCLIMFQRICNI